MITRIFNKDGTVTVVDDGLPAPPPFVDPAAEVVRLEAALAAVAERTGLTKAAAETLAKAPRAKI
jgi:hypothetical protein